MYKQLGMSLDIRPPLTDKVSSLLAKLVMKCKQDNPNFQIEENGRRAFFRAPIDDDSPVELWIYHESEKRYVQVQLKDLSLGGARFVLPYDEPEKTNKVGTILKCMIVINSVSHKLSGSIRSTQELRLSKKYRQLLNDEFYTKKEP